MTELHTYSVVEFSDNSVGIINSSWLTPRKKETFWPPTKDQKQYYKILRNPDPDFTDWKLYEVRCLYESDDLEKAKHKLRLSETTSDLQSDADVPKKRKITKKIYSSEEEEDDPFPKPPKINKGLKRHNLRTQLMQFIENDENSRASSPASELIKSSPCSSTGPIDTGCSTPLAGYQIGLQDTPITSNNENQITTAFQEKCILLLTQIKEQNSKLLQILKEEKKSTYFNISSDLPVHLPIQTEEHLQTLETYISDKDKLSLFAKCLSTIGGGDLTSKVNRILKHILTDSVATLYNFYGKRSDKKPFYPLHLRTAVIESIHLTSPTTSAHDIENAIKVWLKHAPERLKKKQIN